MRDGKNMERTCFSLRPLTIPDNYWMKVEIGVCPFCEQKKIVEWKPIKEKFNWLTCRNCLRVFIIPRISRRIKT